VVAQIEAPEAARQETGASTGRRWRRHLFDVGVVAGAAALITAVPCV